MIVPFIFDSGFDGALSHCVECGLWLSPTDSCLHIQALDDARGDLANLFAAPVHTAENAPGTGTPSSRKTRSISINGR